MTEKFDCGAVNHGKYSVFPPYPLMSLTRTGNCIRTSSHIPVAIIGIVGYSLIGIFALLGRMRIVLELARIGFFCAAFLSYLEAYVIQKWCIYCLWSQCIIAAILVASVVADADAAAAAGGFDGDGAAEQADDHVDPRLGHVAQIALRSVASLCPADADGGQVFLQLEAQSDKAQEAALAALAGDVRGELGKVTEAQAGLRAPVAGAGHADGGIRGGGDAGADGRGERGGAGREAGEDGRTTVQAAGL